MAFPPSKPAGTPGSGTKPNPANLHDAPPTKGSGKPGPVPATSTPTMPSAAHPASAPTTPTGQCAAGIHGMQCTCGV